MKSHSLMFAPAIFACLVATANRASAHAFPSSEQPAVGSTINAAPSAITITFDAPIEHLFAKLDVTNSSGDSEVSANPAVQPDRRTLSVALKPLSPGDYKVNWSVISEDGHRTQGSYSFTVAPGGS